MRKKSFRNKRYTFVAKSFFETSTYLRLSIAYIVNPVGFKKNQFSSESSNIRSFTQPFTDYKWTYWLYCIDMIWSYSPTSFPTIEQSNRTKGQSKPNRKEEDEAYRVLLLAVHQINFLYWADFFKTKLVFIVTVWQEQQQIK